MASFKKGIELIEIKNEKKISEFRLVFVDSLNSSLWCSKLINPNKNLKRCVNIELSRFAFPKSPIESHFSNKQLFVLDKANLFYIEVSSKEFRKLMIHIEDLWKSSKHFKVHSNVEVNFPLERILSGKDKPGTFEFIDLFFFGKKQILVILFRDLSLLEFVGMTYSIPNRSVRVFRIAFTHQVLFNFSCLFVKFSDLIAKTCSLSLILFAKTQAASSK